MNHKNFSIKCENIHKSFKVLRSPKDALMSVLRPDKVPEKSILKGINFTIEKGEIVGILGVNGAGKSTLLKMITGNILPTSGHIHVNGKISAILELGTGFNPEYTGYDNILMGGLANGLSREEIEQKIDWIIDFSELRDVIDQPFYTYSSGMKARLTFSTAVCIDPEIFLVDEALATGDARFAQKSLNRIRSICEKGATSLFVSHSSYHILSLCKRALWIKDGMIAADGDVKDVVRQYEYYLHGQKVQSIPKKDQVSVVADLKDQKFKIDYVELLDKNDHESNLFHVGETLKFRVYYTRLDDTFEIDSLGLAAAINRDSDNLLMCNFNTNHAKSWDDMDAYEDSHYRQKPGHKGYIEAEIPSLQFTEGVYHISFGLLANTRLFSGFFEYHSHACTFSVLSCGYSESGIFYPVINWKTKVLKA